MPKVTKASTLDSATWKSRWNRHYVLEKATEHSHESTTESDEEEEKILIFV